MPSAPLGLYLSRPVAYTATANRVAAPRRRGDSKRH
jgi:hypothetical protein